MVERPRKTDRYDAGGMNRAEQNAVNTLRRLATRWPDTLWLFSGAGSLCVMRKDDNGEHARLSNGGVDPSYIVAGINIENDGGDW